MFELFIAQNATLELIRCRKYYKKFRGSLSWRAIYSKRALVGASKCLAGDEVTRVLKKFI